MVENKNNGLLMAVAAGAALVGAALLYHFVFADDAEEDVDVGNDTDTLLEEMKKAKVDKVQKAPNGAMLHPEYTLKLLNFIS